MNSTLPDPAVLDEDFARCARITREASSNFYYAFMLLPENRRRALYAVYAFCRFIDDIADDQQRESPADLLRKWREELDRVYRNVPTRPISRALADSIGKFSIPREHFEEFIAGVEMDLSRARYQTFDDLYLYCYRVASAVGLMCIEIFGYRNEATKIYAEKLGIAFQLTNIIRDVREDAERGRLYIPLEDLTRFAVTEEEIFSRKYSERLEALIKFEAARAQSYYREAEASRPREDRGSLLTAEAMRLIYGDLLKRIAGSGYRVFDGRVRLSATRKLYLVGRAWAASRLGLALS